MHQHDHRFEAFSADVPTPATWVQADRAAARNARFTPHAPRPEHQPLLAERPSPRRRRSHSELGAAVARGEFFLVYQPIVTVTTGRVAAFEALLRWRHPARGVLHPGDFLRVADQAGALRALTPWILDEASAAASRWNTGARHPVAVSVNLSGAQLRQQDLGDHVIAALREHELDPAQLWFELTEDTGVRQARTNRDALDELRGLGVRIALDDFGSGCASIGCLRDLPLDAIKLDRSLLQQSRTHRGARVLSACTDIVHALGFAVVVEGIERPDQFEHVHALGCEFAQGFYLGRPLARRIADRLALLELPWPAAKALPVLVGSAVPG